MNFLTRLRGLQAPVSFDEPLRLADAGGVTPGPPSPGGSGGLIILRGRDGDDGRRGLALRGLGGPTGPSGAQQPPGAAWSNVVFGAGLQTPTNPVPRLISGTYAIQECVVLTAGGVGSCVINVWKANLSAHYPPIVTDDITGGNNVVISSSSAPHDDSTLTGWTTSLVQGDVLLFSLQSVTNFTYIAIQLRIG
jgi:hypothetical protein